MRITNVIDNMSLNIKLMTLALLALLAILIPTVNYIQESEQSIENTRLEIKGFQSSDYFFHALKAMQLHRGLAAGVLSGNLEQISQLVRVAA